MNITEALWDDKIECEKCKRSFVSFDSNWILMPPKLQVFYTEVSCPYCDHYDLISLKRTKNKIKKKSILERFF